jgi:uncharacterized protein (DUF342 family)
MAQQNGGLDRRNSLIVKIALFLNFLTKENYNRLISDIKKQQNTGRIDVLKIMSQQGYVLSQDLPRLKKTCLSFAKAQEDTRFGYLAIEFGFITSSNLELALEEQKRLLGRGTTIRIGDMLVEAGMLSPRQSKLILEKQRIENTYRKEGEDISDGANGGTSGTEKPKKEFDPTHMREIREPELVFYIQNDALAAYMKKTPNFDSSILLTDLKFLLERVGIIYGVVDDDRLTQFIQAPEYEKEVFRVAKGLAPIDGTDASMVYMFERDYLKAGSLSKDGTIDFKDRGDIPFVSEGDVLAEKIPPKEGKDGVNVYGDVIPQVDARDISFILGKGVRLSEDEKQVIASAEGNPKLQQNGELSVNSAYFIEGDVDYTTGHVKFDKNVYITGTIKSGFRVEAIDVVANTIDGGIVNASGDVFVQNGVTESTIEAKGNIKAGFIHRSKARCLGDFTVVKEVVDTDIIIEGTLDMSTGKMVSSSVCAKGGAKIYSVGSQKAKPSTITVGTSLYLENELADIDKEIERRQNLLEESTTEKNKIESELTAIEEKLKNFYQSQERTQSLIQEMQKQDNPPQLAMFEKSLSEAQQKVHGLNDRKVLLETLMKKADIEIAAHAEAVKVSVKNKFALKRIHQKNPPKPILEVAGKAFGGTKISGRHSHIIINQDITRARIMEMDSSREDNSRPNWEMIITTL